MKLLAAGFSIALVASVLAPLVRAPTDDGYPLSTYPMFATRRPTTLTLDYAFGLAGDGTRRALAPRLIGSIEVLQARAILESGVRGGPSVQRALCDDIAARVARDVDLADVVELHVVTGTHEAVDYLVNHAPGQELTRVVCKVVR